jgi:hypothetical protein
MRALATFVVSTLGIKVRVRLMATTADVRATARSAAVRKHRDTRAYFDPAGPNSPLSGTIVLPLDDDLQELVPHEVSHAVICRCKGVHVNDDETAATAIGVLTSRIHGAIRKRGYE